MWQHFVALGDSLTEGVGDTVDGVPVSSWTDAVVSAIKPKRFTNLAQRGQTSDDLIRLQLPRAVDMQPDFVSVLIGGNDMQVREWQPEQFSANLRLIVERLQATRATLLLMTMIDNSPALPAPLQERAAPMYSRLREVNSIVRETAQAYTTLLLDFEHITMLQVPELWSADFLHPNTTGYQKIGDVVVQFLNREKQ